MIKADRLSYTVIFIVLAVNLASEVWAVDMFRIGARYIGCYMDQTPRDLNGSMTAHDLMSINKCLEFCYKRNYEYAGLQYSYQCFCGMSYGRYGKLNDTSCNSPCRLDTAVMCGGSWKNSVYRIQSVLYNIAITKEYQGCFKDSVDQRDLIGVVFEDENLTADLCAKYCAGRLNYTYAAMQAGFKCFCANTFGKYGIASAETECNAPCAGNKIPINQPAAVPFCGGTLRNSVYKLIVRYLSTMPNRLVNQKVRVGTETTIEAKVTTNQTIL